MGASTTTAKSATTQRGLIKLDEYRFTPQMKAEILAKLKNLKKTPSSAPPSWLGAFALCLLTDHASSRAPTPQVRSSMRPSRNHPGFSPSRTTSGPYGYVSLPSTAAAIPSGRARSLGRLHKHRSRHGRQRSVKLSCLKRIVNFRSILLSRMLPRGLPSPLAVAVVVAVAVAVAVDVWNGVGERGMCFVPFAVSSVVSWLSPPSPRGPLHARTRSLICV